jgi:short-subunit dehydrogenase
MIVAGRRALVTGATGGLGRAIARALAGERVELVLTGRRTEELDSLAAELGAQPLAADLNSQSAVAGLVRDAGRVDILVSNAALPASGRLDDFSAEEINRAIAVNLSAPMLLARHLIDGMIERRSGHLVFVGSLGGKAASPLVSVYSATKFGLRGFALSLRQELRGSGVGVSVVLPGPIRDAGMFADAGVELPRGMGTRSPEDVAAAVLRAVREDIAELAVADRGIRVGAAMAAISPRIGEAMQRLGHASNLMSGLARGQRAKR